MLQHYIVCLAAMCTKHTKRRYVQLVGLQIVFQSYQLHCVLLFFFSSEPSFAAVSVRGLSSLVCIVRHTVCVVGLLAHPGEGGVARQPELPLRQLPADGRHQLPRIEALRRGHEGQLRVPPVPGENAAVPPAVLPAVGRDTYIGVYEIVLSDEDRSCSCSVWHRPHPCCDESSEVTTAVRAWSSSEPRPSETNCRLLFCFCHRLVGSSVAKTNPNLDDLS